MSKVIQFPGSNDNTPTGPQGPKEGTRPPPHVFEIRYVSGNSELAEGYLSVGPIFVAVVDSNDFVELVVGVDHIESVKKLCTVEDWYSESDDEEG